MKLDYMVYGRGIEQDEGFALRAAPSYVRQELLLYLSRFQELGDDRLTAQLDPSLAAGAQDPWAGTYLFLCQPPPYCCVLVRITRAEGDEPGTWLQEVRGKSIWSLEGWCAPYEQRETFFALTPSLLRWMAEDSSSLYNRHRLRRIPQPVELPEIYVCSPYTEELPDFSADSPALREVLGQLCRAIRYAGQPFAFLFGPLARFFMERIGESYHVSQVFVPGESLPETPDLFDQIEYAAMREPAAQAHSYALRLHLERTGRHSTERRWGIYEPKHTLSAKDDILRSAPVSCVPEQGYAMAELLAEADAIRRFAERMGWETSPQTAPPEQRYRFTKEGS